ncbi:MAG TPA: hypothetical protein VFR71_00130 [Methyloceanibacter sp.]|nr:hypothetical protein [Methyloceanibacter sp.]
MHLALLLSQATVAYAADLGLPPPPPPEPCVGCVGPWYLKGFVGAANPHVGGLDYELNGPNFEFFTKTSKARRCSAWAWVTTPAIISGSTSPASIAARSCSSLRTDIV